MDYFATGKLNVAQATTVIEGIAEGCRLSGCALIGGETAEMPGMYAKDDFDLAGFAVGAMERGTHLPQGVAALQGGSFWALRAWALCSQVTLRSPLALGDAMALGDRGPWGPIGPWDTGPLGKGPLGPATSLVTSPGGESILDDDPPICFLAVSAFSGSPATWAIAHACEVYRIEMLCPSRSKSEKLRF